jgi:hypothetical protein
MQACSRKLTATLPLLSLQGLADEEGIELSSDDEGGVCSSDLRVAVSHHAASRAAPPGAMSKHATGQNAAAQALLLTQYEEDICTLRVRVGGMPGMRRWHMWPCKAN